MNKEYIEREKVVAFLENMAASRYLIHCFENKEKFPAADVEPVRHGEWESVLVKFGSRANTYVGREKCSVCGSLEVEQTKFCPNCGTRMDGGK